MGVQLSKTQNDLKNKFIETNGYWSLSLKRLLIMDEAFFETYLQFSLVPYKKNALSDKVKELICIAINSSVTHLSESGTRTHIKKALQNGATKEEIMEVLELTSILGMHGSSLGVPILFNELGNNDDVQTPLSEHQVKLKNKFIEKMGYWSPYRDRLLSVDENYFGAYLDLITHPWNHGVLEPKMKEFIYIAIDSSTTHLYELGLKMHVKKALSYGSTMEEIMEVYQLTSALSLQTAEMGMSILYEELEKF